MNKFLERIRKMSTMNLTALIAFVGLLVLFCTIPIQKSNLSDKWVDFLVSFLSALGFYIGGCCLGLVYIIRRECPILPLGHAIKGWGAVLIGGILFVLGLINGSLALALMWKY